MNRMIPRLGTNLPILAFAILAAGAASIGTARAEATAGLRIATFGTSLTSGGGWQAPLATAIEACTKRPAEVANFGRAGAASDWGVEAVSKVSASRPDVLLLEFAVNDAALNAFISITGSVANMRHIIEDVRRQRPDVIVYIMSMNPLSGRRYWVRPWRDSYEDAHRALAEELGLRYIDHRPDWDKLGPDTLRLVIADGSHPEPSAATAIVVPNVMVRFKRDGVIRCDDDAAN